MPSNSKKSQEVHENICNSSNNLIDLARETSDDKNSVRVSILEAFDPLLTEQISREQSNSDYSGNVIQIYQFVFE